MCVRVRYARSVPVMPSLSVPPFNRSSPHCQLTGSRRPPTVTRVKPLDQLDAAHFFSTGAATDPSPTPHDADTSPWLPSVVGGNVAEEYRLLASGTQSSAVSAVAGAPRRQHGHGGYLELLDLDALRIVFLLLDDGSLSDDKYCLSLSSTMSAVVLVSAESEDCLPATRRPAAAPSHHQRLRWRSAPATVLIV